MRKGVGSRTQHPISNYVSYSHLSPSFHVFATNLSDIEIPRNVEEALKVSEQRKVMIEQMKGLEKIGK